MYNFGTTLIKNSNSNLIYSYALFKAKKNLTIGFKSFGFVCFSTCTCVAFQLIALQLHIAVCYLGNCCFQCWLRPSLPKFIEKNVITC